MGVKYVLGDATKPIVDAGAFNVIIHSCNNKRVWGAGFVLALNKAGSTAKDAYMKADTVELGTVSFGNIGRYVYVANIVAQDGLISKSNPVPFSLNAFMHGLIIVYNKSPLRRNLFHLPRVGSGLGGAEWEPTHNALAWFSDSYHCDFIVYDLEPIPNTEYTEISSLHDNAVLNV